MSQGIKLSGAHGNSVGRVVFVNQEPETWEWATDYATPPSRRFATCAMIVAQSPRLPPLMRHGAQDSPTRRAQLALFDVLDVQNRSAMREPWRDGGNGWMLGARLFFQVQE